MQDAPAFPTELNEIAKSPRIYVRRSGPLRPDARCVVYWMQRAMRVQDNPALDTAVHVANLLGLPVVIFFSVIPNYPNANLRHYHFMAQGLRDVAEDAAARGVGFVVRRPPDNSLQDFLEEVQAAMLIGDENPCREPERWRHVLAQKLRIPYCTVDADVVVPSRVFGKAFFLLHHFRPHLKRELPNYLVAPENLKPHRPWAPKRTLASYPLDQDITKGFDKLDRTVQLVDTFTGGTHAALKELNDFVNHRLARYEELRNHPEVKGTSHMSPYLHFGNISPITIALAAERAVKNGKAPAQAKDKFLDELIGWRELSALFVRYNPNYDNWECAEPWARKTLLEHAGDPRPFRYTLKQLEHAQTHDDLWNAGQRQMVDTGWMHNVLRMYWAKKILEWAPDPATAFDWAVILNDKYELDGRDPNGYAGIAWAIVGKHDRPWFDRPIFGVVRTMTGASTAKKFDAQAYIRTHLGEAPQPPLF